MMSANEEESSRSIVLQEGISHFEQWLQTMAVTILSPVRKN